MFLQLSRLFVYVCVCVCLCGKGRGLSLPQLFRFCVVFFCIHNFFKFFYVLCVIVVAVVVVVIVEETPRMGAADCFVPALKRPKSPTFLAFPSPTLPSPSILLFPFLSMTLCLWCLQFYLFIYIRFLRARL